MTTTAVHPSSASQVGSYGIVIMSGSAGALEALKTVLGGLDRTFPIPIVLVLHHAAGQSPMLVSVVSRMTNLEVLEAIDGSALHPGRLYVAPSDRHMEITAKHTVASSDHRKINHLHSSSDPLLASVRDEFGAKAIAVILSGTGRNGAIGAKALHDAGGIVLAQDRESSRQFGMAGAAIEIGAVDRVLPLDDIAPTLVALTHAPSTQ